MRACSRPTARFPGRVPALLLGLSMALLPSPAASAQGLKGDYHEDARFGFKIKPPKDWKGIPVPAGQSWVIGKYLSEKKYFYTEKGSYTYEFQPEMTIVAFVSEEMKKAARRKVVDEAEDEQTKKELEAEYERQERSELRDFEEYLTQANRGDGFFISKEETGEIGGMQGTLYEAKIERMAYGGPKRIVAWVFELPDVDIAVQMVVLEQDYDELAPMLDASFRSLKTIPREGQMPLLQSQTGGFTSYAEMEQMTLAERTAKRIDLERTLHERAATGLARGWHHEKIDGFVVVSCADGPFDRKVVAQGKAVLEWLDDTFPYVGAGEYVRGPIIRVCKDFEEEQAFRKGRGSLGGVNTELEVTTNKEWGGARTSETGYINTRMVDIWFTDRDRRLWWSMPAWLQQGIYAMARESTAKGGRLDFYRSEATNTVLRKLASEDRALEPVELIYMTDSDFRGSNATDYDERIQQAQALVEYFLIGPGAKNSMTKDVIEDYLASVKAVVTELAADDEATKAEGEQPKPTTEAEEEAALKEQRDLWRARERQLIDEAGRRAFSGWDEKDWNDLARNYFRSF